MEGLPTRCGNDTQLNHLIPSMAAWATEKSIEIPQLQCQPHESHESPPTCGSRIVEGHAMWHISAEAPCHFHFPGKSPKVLTSPCDILDKIRENPTISTIFLLLSICYQLHPLRDNRKMALGTTVFVGVQRASFECSERLSTSVTNVNSSNSPHPRYMILLQYYNHMVVHLILWNAKRPQ